MAHRRRSETDVTEYDGLVTEIAESIDNDSPAGTSASASASANANVNASSTTTGICRRCGATAGDFFNAWHKITTSYFLPALVGSYRSRLRTAGERKRASIGTELSGW